jgi:hypothetical protein
MDALKHWRDTQSDAPLVAPNSARGKAIASMRTRGQTLTRFLWIPGAPLDHNLAERVVQLFIRQRQTSLLYKTPHSASMASVLTSLIAPCLYAGVEAVEYLVARQEHRREVWWNPAAWLPWVSARSRASPEAPRRQSWASGARSGTPLHRKTLSSRADKGPRASALVGQPRHRPVERLFMQSQ